MTTRIKTFEFAAKNLRNYRSSRAAEAPLSTEDFRFKPTSCVLASVHYGGIYGAFIGERVTLSVDTARLHVSFFLASFSQINWNSGFCHFNDKNVLAPTSLLAIRPRIQGLGNVHA